MFFYLFLFIYEMMYLYVILKSSYIKLKYRNKRSFTEYKISHCMGFNQLGIIFIYNKGMILRQNIMRLFLGLDTGECDSENLARLKTLIPQSLWEYLDSKYSLYKLVG